MYHQSLPSSAKKFIEKVQNSKNQYIFGVCTYGDNPCLSLEYLDNLLKKKNAYLSCGFSIRMPYNYLSPRVKVKDFFKCFKLKSLPLDEKKKYSEESKKMDKIFSYVNQVKEGIIEKDAVIIEKVSDFLNLRNTLQKKIWLKVAGYSADTNISFNEGILLMDYGFHVNSHCNGCGICKKVCPVQNITIVNERPQR